MADCPKIFREIFRYTDWPVKLETSPGYKDEPEVKFRPDGELAAVRWFGKHKHMIGKTKFRAMHLYEDNISWVLASVVRKAETDNEGA